MSFGQETPKKKVDADWLKQVEEDKLKEKPEKPVQEKAPPGSHEVNFTLFLSTMALQGYVALGELDDPTTRTKKMNLDQAKYMIEMLGVIEEKTKGNRSKEEDSTIKNILYDLRMKYVQKSKA